MFDILWRRPFSLTHLYTCVFMVLFHRCNTHGENKTKLTLAGVISLNTTSGWSSGGIIPAVELALDDVNNRSHVLQDYELTLDWEDDKCIPGLASHLLAQHVYNGTQKIMVLGSGCSIATVYVASFSHYSNLIQVSYSAASPELSDTSSYPLFFRTQQSDLAHNTVRIAIMNRFKWKRVAALYQNEKFFVQVIDQLILKMRRHDISSLVSLPFDYQPSDDLRIVKIINQFLSMLEDADVALVKALMIRSHSEQELRIVKENDGRIIVVHSYEDHARALFCSAYRLGMYGSEYAWMIPGWYAADWWSEPDDRINCTENEMRTVLESVIETVQVGSDNSSNQTTINGETIGQYEARYLHRLQTYPKYKHLVYHDWHGLGYDAIWAMALTLNSSLEEVSRSNVTDTDGSVRSKRLDDFNYSDEQMANIFKTHFANISFAGVSGQVWFNEYQDRIGKMAIYQIRDGQRSYLGECDSEGNMKIFRPFAWEGGHYPIDGQRVEYKILNISNGHFITFAVFSALGVTMAATFFAFNVKYSHHGFVKLSSPRMNNIILAGMSLVYLSIIPHGLAECAFMGDNFTGRTIGCVTAAWFLSIGFSLAFGSMFAKTWRVHRIFTTLTPRPAKVKDKRLMIFVTSLVLVDIIILATWQIVDPRETYLKTISVDQVSEIRTQTVKQAYECTSEFTWWWTGAIYVQKGLLLLFGCFLAFETRNIQVEGLNDSRQISISIYNIMMASVVGITLSLALDNNPTFSYAFESSLIFLCSTSTLFMMFLPKIFAVRKDPTGSKYLQKRTREGLTVAMTMDDLRRNDGMRTAGSDATLNTNVE